MNCSTAVIILVKQSFLEIEENMRLYDIYCGKYQNVKRIIFILSKSFNECPDYHTEKVYCVKQDARKTLRETIVENVSLCVEDNIIFLDPYFNTRLHQIQRQIGKLRRCNVVLPDRFHKLSRTTFQNGLEAAKIRLFNMFLVFFTGLPFHDLTNLNVGFKRKVFLQYKYKTDNFIFIELLRHKKDLRISECPAHYVEPLKPFLPKWLMIFRELKKIKK